MTNEVSRGMLQDQSPGEATERRGAERSEGPRSGEASPGERRRDGGVPDPQVPARAKRRRFTAEFKLRVLREAERCRKPGEIGALVRRHGIYTSHLSTWRRERDQAARGRLGRKRGRKPRDPNPLTPRVVQLEQEIHRFQVQLRRAELIIEIQKKASALLGIPLNSPDSEGSD